jgi:hypothetical protein
MVLFAQSFIKSFIIRPEIFTRVAGLVPQQRNKLFIIFQENNNLISFPNPNFIIFLSMLMASPAGQCL